MSAIENKAIARSYLEKVWEERRFDLFADFIAKDVAFHSSLKVLGQKDVRDAATAIFEAFADFVQTIEDEITEGDKVVVRWIRSGTQKGELFGMPPTGKRAVWSGTSIFRLAGGKIVELWVESDTMSMMQQLGAIPTPGQNLNAEPPVVCGGG